MAKPSLEEFSLFASKVGLPEPEAERAYFYYEANGWKVGRNPMKNWQAAIHYWFRNWKDRNVHRNPAPAVSRGTMLMELEKVEQEMAKIKGRASTDAFGFYIEQSDKAQWEKLRARKKELKGQLGL